MEKDIKNDQVKKIHTHLEKCFLQKIKLKDQKKKKIFWNIIDTWNIT